MSGPEVQTRPHAAAGATDGASEQPAHAIEAGPPKRRSLAPLWYVLGAIALIALLVWGIPYIAYLRSHQSTDDARVDASTVAVTSKIAERVQSILVDTDQRVHRGQLLIVLDSATEQASLDQAKANLQLALENQNALAAQGIGGVQEAQGNVQGAAALVPVSVAGVAAAQAQVQVAEAELPGAAQALAKARADLARTQSLVNTGDIARQQLDSARAAYAQAASAYRSAADNVSVALANVNAAQQKVGASQAGIAAAQGGVTTAQGKLAQAREPAQIAGQRAAVAIAQQNFANTKIYSPIDGSVGQKNVEIGQTVNGGMTLLTLIPHGVFITANYKETQVGKMRPGQPVDIHVDAYKGVTFHGRVLALNPASQNTYALVPAQNSTGNFVKVTQRIPVKISIGDADPQRYPMRPGMSVETAVRVN